MRLPTYKNAEGFSIVELSVTLIVAGMAVVIISTLYSSASRLSDRSEDTMAANSAAYAKLQSYENLPFDEIPDRNADNSIPFEEDFTNSLPATLPFPKSGEVFITSQSQNLKFILVRVKYGSGAQEKVVEYADLIQSGGLGR